MRSTVLVGALLCACGATEVHEVIVPVHRLAQVDASQLVGFELWILDQVGRDDAPIDCARLLSRALSPLDDNVVRLRDPIVGAIGGEVKIGDILAGAQNRIFYVDVFANDELLGARVAAGCTQSVTIVGGKDTRVAISLVPPPPPSLSR
ncbi:MAG: hypothetical protein IT381_21815 [Deltaproteobacteria bacterium]|nr:hypothetical protein [Deltaproteobacteria bacterium]